MKRINCAPVRLATDDISQLKHLNIERPYVCLYVCVRACVRACVWVQIMNKNKKFILTPLNTNIIN